MIRGIFIYSSLFPAAKSAATTSPTTPPTTKPITNPITPPLPSTGFPFRPRPADQAVALVDLYPAVHVGHKGAAIDLDNAVLFVRAHQHGVWIHSHRVLLYRSRDTTVDAVVLISASDNPWFAFVARIVNPFVPILMMLNANPDCTSPVMVTTAKSAP